mgnify:FL=1
MITETVGNKVSAFSEYVVSSNGQVSEDGENRTLLQLVGVEVIYNAELNQDGEISLLMVQATLVIGENSVPAPEI